MERRSPRQYDRRNLLGATSQQLGTALCAAISRRVRGKDTLQKRLFAHENVIDAQLQRQNQLQYYTDVVKTEREVTDQQTAQSSARLQAEENQINAMMLQYEKLQQKWASRKTAREQENVPLLQKIASIQPVVPPFDPPTFLNLVGEPTHPPSRPMRPPRSSMSPDAKFHDAPALKIHYGAANDRQFAEPPNRPCAECQPAASVYAGMCAHD